jgi:hypothetical protein
MGGEGDRSLPPSLVPWLMERDRDQPVVVQLVSGEIPQVIAKNLVTFPKTSFRDESLQDLIMKREWLCS